MIMVCEYRNKHSNPNTAVNAVAVAYIGCWLFVATSDFILSLALALFLGILSMLVYMHLVHMSNVQL